MLIYLLALELTHLQGVSLTTSWVHVLFHTIIATHHWKSIKSGKEFRKTNGNMEWR